MTPDHLHIYVKDRPAAEQWYARVLGFTRVPEFEFWADENGPLMLRRVDSPFKIALFQRASEAQVHSTIAFATSAQEFVSIKAHLTAELDQPPALEDHDIAWSLYFTDPEGNPFEITTYEYKAALELLKSSL